MEGSKQIATDPVQPLHDLEALGIPSGNLHSLESTIDRPDLGLGQGMRQTDRQAPTPRTDVKDGEARLRMGYTPLLRQTCAMFNQQFAFRAWDEDVRVDFKLQRPEFLPASNVLHWFALRPALQACHEGSILVWTEGTGRIDIQTRTGRPQHISQQHFRRRLRLRHPELLQTAYGLSEHGADSLAHPSTACSFAVRSASDNASMTSSSFPAMISSSLYRVS